MRLTDLIPAIAMGMPYINTVILVYLQVLDPDPGIRMRNPASANDSLREDHPIRLAQTIRNQYDKEKRAAVGSVADAEC